MRNYTWKFWRLLLKYLFKQWGCFSISKSGSSSSRPLLLFFDMCLHWMLNDIHFVQIPAISILRVPSFCSSSSSSSFRRGMARQIRTPFLPSLDEKKNKGKSTFFVTNFFLGNFSGVASARWYGPMQWFRSHIVVATIEFSLCLQPFSFAFRQEPLWGRVEGGLEWLYSEQHCLFLSKPEHNVTKWTLSVRKWTLNGPLIVLSDAWSWHHEKVV